MLVFMSNNKEITREDKLALIKIIMDYLRGEKIGRIKSRLKEQLDEYKIACKDCYERIQPSKDDGDYDKGINEILDELSIGGRQLHLMSTKKAKTLDYFNCYVWDGQKLEYISSDGESNDVKLADYKLFEDGIKTLIPTHKKIPTFHLFASQINELITLNLADGQLALHTDQNYNDYVTSRSLYDALKKLSIQHPHLTHLIKLIDETKPDYNWPLYFIFAAGLTAGSGIFWYVKENIGLVKAWYERSLPIISRLLGDTVYLLRNTPLIGVLFNAVPLTYLWSQAIVDGSILSSKGLIKLGFKTAEFGLPIIGYVLCYLAAGAMTVPALAVFITGALLNVVETLYTLICNELDRIKNPLAPSSDYYSEKDNLCADNFKKRSRFVFMVNFVANLLLAASVVVWCVFPPSLMIALPCMTFAWLVGKAKTSLLAKTGKENADALQEKLLDIYKNKYTPPLHTAVPKSGKSSLFSVVTENMALRKQLEQKTWREEGYKACIADLAKHGLFKSSPTANVPSNDADMSETAAKSRPI